MGFGAEQKGAASVVYTGDAFTKLTGTGSRSGTNYETVSTETETDE